ncbi:hypothetical protein EYF80_027675 [Liparis tanakae]|uniref:Uncharacterized protein n=1 Tax=Liparis tanakae TaxID=230148 RepID=A0A4Z2HB22_9TELE|nr:hypothetical protein EYF80_027675 [Liparis tanakae]
MCSAGRFSLRTVEPALGSSPSMRFLWTGGRPFLLRTEPALLLEPDVTDMWSSSPPEISGSHTSSRRSDIDSDMNFSRYEWLGRHAAGSGQSPSTECAKRSVISSMSCERAMSTRFMMVYSSEQRMLTSISMCFSTTRRICFSRASRCFSMRPALYTSRSKN